MPRTGKKMKTHRGAHKRFRTTGSGKIVRKRSGKRHLLSHKSARRKRGYTVPAVLSAAEQTMVKRLLPYGGKT
jgi:large subunit ribosomal protein L35